MASNISNDDGNYEVVSFQGMMTHLSKIENGTSSLTPDRQIQLIDALQIQLNDMFIRLRQQVSTRAHPTASVAYPPYGLSQLQGSDWEDSNLHDAGSYGSGPSSFGNMSSYSTTSTISARSNSSRRRRSFSSQVITTTSSVSSASSSRADDEDNIKAILAQQAQALTILQAKLEAAESAIIYLQNTQRTTVETVKNAQDIVSNLSMPTASSGGSTYVRWGRSQCPNTTETLYSGIAGGSWTHNSGGAANRLCLTLEPVVDNVHLAGIEIGRLYGAEYDLQGHERTDVVCALCYTSYSSTFMVPGTNRCPSGTVSQYTGQLTAGNVNDQAASEYLCLDENLEEVANSSQQFDSMYFVGVLTKCGSLPCPPYADGKSVTCVVCSK